MWPQSMLITTRVCRRGFPLRSSGTDFATPRRRTRLPAAGLAEQDLLAVPRSAFELEHLALRRQTARCREPGERPVRRDDTVARDDDREPVPAERHADVARRLRAADRACDLAVA